MQNNTYPARGRNDWAAVKDQSNLEEYILEQCEAHAKRAGSTVFINPAPCCQHKDCYAISADGMLFKCHSCGAGGDIFTFHEMHHSTDKANALKAVAARYGVTLSAPKAQKSSRDFRGKASSADGGGEPSPRKNSRLAEILNAAAAHYQHNLARRPEFMAKLMAPKIDGGRGHNEQTIKRLEIGFSDGRLAQTLKQQGFSFEEIKASGLFVERERKQEGSDETIKKWCDFFTPGVYIFPHRTEDGEIGHFTIKDPRKKIDYQLKNEHRLGGLKFGNQRAISGDKVIICEGEHDLASFFDAGVHFAIATLGHLSEAQIQWLLTHSSGKRFILFFDNDNKPGANGKPPAGVAYTRKLYKHLLRQPDCEVVVASATMAPGEDPDDFIQRDIGSARTRVQNAISSALDPLSWELGKIPDEIRASHTATLSHLKEIDFFSSLGQTEELMRDAIMGELQSFGFSRDAVMNAIQDGYNLMEVLTELKTAMNPGKTPDEIYMRAVSDKIWTWLKDRGKFFVTGDDNLCLFYQQVIYQIGANVAWKSLMRREAGLNATQPTTKYVNEEISSLCFDRGERLSAFTWVHYQDDGSPSLFINLNDPANRIMRVGARSIDLVENGTNKEQILLAQSHQMTPFKYDPEVDVRAAMEDLKALVFDSMSCAPAQRYLVLAWTLSAFMLPLSEARALMKMEGGSASGKTTAAKYCSLLLYGDNLVGRLTSAGAYSMGATEPMLIMDNMETDNLNKMMLDFLLLASTGASNIKRKGGSDTGVVREKINCLVAITAIEPFTKPELINRTYLVEFSKKYRRSGFIDETVSARLLARRDKILSAWMKVLADDILPAMDDRAILLEYIQQNHPHSSKDRTNAFMSMLALIARSIERYIPLDKEIAGSKKPERALIDEWVRIQDEQAKLTEAGTNDVLQFLDSIRNDYLLAFASTDQLDKSEDGWESLVNRQIGLKIDRKEIHGERPGQRWYEYRFEASTKGLLDVFQRHARERGIRAPWKSARQLGVRISNERETLSAAGWSRDEGRKVRGERYQWYVWSAGPE